ncbi:hypothetical protein [Clostridium pasteurianum]|uniref:Uncharacterized protein n=1 Tax=Clostridium pasteurianum BC1 TaxID=86416 RepID=R4KAZ0_CLOPA|nr:hypothetical protein [Clostridium pasteurianum]AGK97684.1 hypothetical protein Clopa_2846 [Clostridium pasteurianum BC1]
MEYNFLPYWYKEKYNNKKKYFVNIIAVFFIIISFISIYRFINIYNKTSVLEDSIKNGYYASSAESKNNSVNNNVTLENFKNFFEYVDKKLKFENINTENKIVNASIVLSDKKEYEDAVKYIEDNSSFKIIRLSPPQKEADNIFKFQISVEVNK